MQVAFRQAPLVLHPAGIYELAAAPEKESSACFKDPHWIGCDGEFDHFGVQTARSKCFITPLVPSQDCRIRDVLALLLGVGPNVTPQALAKLLIRGRHTTSLPQLEMLANLTDCGERTGVSVGEGRNYSFVETGNAQSPVSLACFYRVSRDWSAIECGFDMDLVRERPFQLLIPNSVRGDY